MEFLFLFTALLLLNCIVIQFSRYSFNKWLISAAIVIICSPVVGTIAGSIFGYIEKSGFGAGFFGFISGGLFFLNGVIFIFMAFLFSRKKNA
ncbi:hypothetical protein FC756_05465 [Lysinibacillus mangiferihumi]|uniref:Uncharacterized protein n=1 Tax=Lysinibacillus mangiferihumi TaxID=1130819 RepID=A0A4U2ZE39_9BACI|nr:hypothetical protein [Lysinibacillus mangiferihumi]TKI71551.1 hypothetical protein FC756_05465 [Lysinibacillus mangiferihumi]